NRSFAVAFQIRDGGDKIVTDCKRAGQAKHGMKNEFVRRDSELSVEGARTTRVQLELSVVDNNALLFRKLTRAFHDHGFSCDAGNFESNVPILGTMHDEQ